MTLLLIDDQGTPWNGASRELRSAFDSPYSGGEFIEYAVINLGFVAVNTYGNSYQVRIRPAIVSKTALGTLATRLASTKVDRVVLSSFDGEWSNELIPSQIAVLRRIKELIVEAARAKPEDFLSRPTETVRGPAGAAISQILKNWARLSQHNGQHELMQRLSAAFGDRYVVVQQDSRDRTVVFKEMGGGLFSNYETWKSCAIGAPVEEQPDRNYGRWVAKVCQDAFTTNTPRLDDIDALVRWPHAGRTRLRYKRLLLPIDAGASGQLLVSASLMDPSIDLRIASNG